MKATVLVRPKPGILDPQGQAVESSLRHLGFTVDDVRVGRVVDLEIDANDAADARAEVERMCEQLLANALIDRLHGRGIHIIVTSGYSAPPVSLEKVAAILQKPIGEARLIESMRPVAARKSAQ